MPTKPVLSGAMCHCYEPVEELSESERTELVTEHSADELRAEYSSEELEALGVGA